MLADFEEPTDAVAFGDVDFGAFGVGDLETPFGAVLLDLATAFVVDGGALDALGYAELTAFFSNTPALVGFSFHLQAAVGSVPRLTNRTDVELTGL